MQKSITVEQAIKRGHIIINLPAILIFVLSLAYCIHLVVSHGRHAVVILIGVIVSGFIAFVYRFIMITRWKFWAFKQVDQIQQLKKRAQKAWFINGKNIFEEREIRSATNHKKWLLIKERIENESNSTGNDKN